MDHSLGSDTHLFALPFGTKLYEFEIDGVLGHGGFGITYRANDTLLQETVAIKEFLPNEVAVRVTDATIRAKSERDRPDFETGLRSFLEEARVMARFRHPRIVHVRRFFEMHGTGYIVLDYEHGMTLSDRLGADSLPEAELRGLLSGILDGLEVIHNRAILHRDLKPNNIMLREDGAPVIIDFGAARDFQARHSRSVTAIATAGYAPPEQYGVGGQQGPWSDLYALGAIAYRAVSGMTPTDSLRRLRSDPLVPAVTVAAGKYDETLLRTIDWMLKVDEAERPVSVAQVREALGGGSVPAFGLSPAHVPALAPPGRPGSAEALQSARPKAPRSAFRLRKLAAIAASLLVLAGVAAGSYALYVNKQAELLARQREQTWQNLAQQFNEAGPDQTKLEQFLAVCNLDCPGDLRSQAQARIEDINVQKRQAEVVRGLQLQQRFAERNLRSMIFSPAPSATKLEAQLRSCGESCPEWLKRQTGAQISEIRQVMAREDESTYLSAVSDVDKLKSYIVNCRVCAYVNDAAADLQRLADQKEAQMKKESEERNAVMLQANAARAEAIEYMQARGSIERLRSYTYACKVCTHLSEARDEADMLEKKAGEFTFEVCNKSRYDAYVAVSGRKNSEQARLIVEGWWEVLPGACTHIGSYARGSFYYTAFSKKTGREWQGSYDMCVPERNFSVDHEQASRCKSASKKKKFLVREYNGGARKWTLVD